MLTTENSRGSSERIQSIKQEQEFRTFMGDSSFNQLKLRNISNNVPSPQIFHNDKRFIEFSLSTDDGYSTDSRSNTTASISSPLSSSLSSLSTFEGSPNCGITHSSLPVTQNYGHTSSHTSSMQSGPIQKAPNLHVNSRTNVSRNGGLPVKRRGVKVEEPDSVSSLEDRLRALTTIEEEESGVSMTDRGVNARNGLNKISQLTGAMNLQNSTRDNRHAKVTVENMNFDTDSNYASGYYRALPVANIDAGSFSAYGNSVREALETIDDNSGAGNVYYHIGSGDCVVISQSHDVYGESWKSYTHLFEKVSDVPAHNIDMAAQRKFLLKNNVNIQRQTRKGSPELSRKHGFGLNQNDERGVIVPDLAQNVIDQSGQKEGLKRAYFEQGDSNEGNGYNTGRQHSPSNNLTFRSVPYLQSQDPSLFSGQMSSPVSQNQTFILEGYPFYDQLQQQYHLHHHQQQQQQHHVVSHEQAFPNYLHEQLPNSPPVFSDHYRNLQPSYRTSVDTSSNISQEDGVSRSPQSYPGTILKRSQDTTTVMSAGICEDQTSWHPRNSLDQRLLAECKKLNSMGLERSSLDLGNIPNLQRQIRATSELCLQASRKHMFASSADIHKLFSGQKKPPVSLQILKSESDQKDHSYGHNTRCSVMVAGPTSSEFVQDSMRPKPKLQVLIQSEPPIAVSSNPIRADHSIHIPLEAWTHVTSLPNSASSENDRIYFQMQNQPLAVHADLSRPAFLRSQSACADLGTDRPQFSLSSGYSSESELQQIESNANAIKKLLNLQGVEKVKSYPVQDFMPLNRSVEDDSNTDTDNFDDITENEPVYENQSVLVRTETFDSLNFPQKTSPLSQLSSVHHLVPHYVISAQEQSPTRPFQNSYSASSFNSSSDIIKLSNSIQNIRNSRYSDPTDTQNQVINKPSVVTGHLTSQQNSMQDYNFTNSFNNNVKNSSTLKIHSSSTSHPTQHNLYSHELPACNNEGHLKSSAVHSHSGHSVHQSGQSQLQGSHLDYAQRSSRSSFVKLSPFENAHILDVPFETNIISDDQGDRLSTLV